VRFPLVDGEEIDLYSSLRDMHEQFDYTSCFYDETFRRIILKLPRMSLTIFCTGKAMVYSLAEERELQGFLDYLWDDFLKKNVRKQ